MSGISWTLTSNAADLVPAPLRSRCREFLLRDLTTEELVAFALREQVRRGLSDEVLDGVIGAVKSVASSQVRPSLRTITRLLELAERQDHRPVLH